MVLIDPYNQPYALDGIRLVKTLSVLSTSNLKIPSK